MKPDISIIVPVYNVASYLASCLDSILAQTFTNYELILIDDGSVDGSRAIAERYAKEHPKQIFFFTTEHIGPGPARNLGIANAKGEYTIFIDSDDTVDKIMLEKLYTSASALNTQVTICPYYRQGLYHEITMEGLFDFDPDKVYRGTDFLLQTDPKITTCSKLYKTDFIRKFSFPAIWFEDVAWLVVVMSYTETIGYVPQAFYHYLRHDASIVSSISNEQILGSIHAVRFFISHSSPEQKKAVADYTSRVLLYMCIRRPAFADLYVDLMIQYKDFILENCDFTDSSLKKRYEYYYHDFIPIPKQIYYDHFGKQPLTGEEEQNVKNWIGTLVEFDAKITCLNEDNCDITENPWIKKAYEQGNYTFVGQYFKCKTLYEKGGIALTPKVQGRKYITPLLLRTRSLFGFYDAEKINTDIYASAPIQPVFKELLALFEEEAASGSPDFSHILYKGLLECENFYYSPELETNFKKKYISLKDDTVRIYATGVFTNDYNINASYAIVPKRTWETVEKEHHTYQLVDDFYYQNLQQVTREYQTYQQNDSRKKRTEETTELKRKICKMRVRIGRLSSRAARKQAQEEKRTSQFEAKIAKLNRRSEKQQKEIESLKSQLRRTSKELNDVKSVKPIWFLYRLFRKLFRRKR